MDLVECYNTGLNQGNNQYFVPLCCRITIKLIDLAGDMHLVMTIFQGGFGMHSVKGGVEMNAVNTPGVSFTTGEERHVVIYNSDTGFKVIQRRLCDHIWRLIKRDIRCSGQSLTEGLNAFVDFSPLGTLSQELFC